MKQGLLAVIIILVCTTAKAQQDPQFTQWMFNKMTFNPGATSAGAMDNELCLTGIFRNQWNGFEGGPKTGLFNGAFRTSNVGLGLTMYNDKLGQQTNSVLRLSGAYHHALSNGNQISGGLAVGLYNSSLGSDWRAIDSPANDPVISPLLNGASDGALDVNLGVYFSKTNAYYAGLSVTHLNSPKLAQLGIDITPHIYVMGGYNFDISSGGAWMLRTNVMAKTDVNATSLDLNANVLWNETFWFGASYRNSDAISPMLGYQSVWSGSNEESCAVNKIKIGYAYDITTSEIKNYSSGSHELFVTYCRVFCKPEPVIRYGNPRFL